MKNNLVFSYLTLRNLIGISGMALPFILLLFTTSKENNRVIENSISDYYYTSSGDLLVVSLSILGVFMLTYQGYNISEKILTGIAAIAAVGIAFSPTAARLSNSKSLHVFREEVPQILGVERHFIFAVLFFVCLAIMCLRYFPLSDKPPEGQKLKRNRVFYACGWIIVGCTLALGVYFLFNPKTDFPVIFVLEVIAIEAFGISWITKGQMLYPD